MKRKGSAGTSFNEAEAFTPRIHRLVRLPLPAAESFNEAEAFTPRIQRDADRDGRSDKASMRPRLLHLGYMEREGLCR